MFFIKRNPLPILIPCHRVGYIHIENDIRYIPAVRYHRYSAVYRHIKGYVAHLPLFAFPLTSFTSRRYTLVLDAHELSGL